MACENHRVFRDTNIVFSPDREVAKNAKVLATCKVSEQFLNFQFQIVRNRVDRQMSFPAIDPFGRAPGFSEESVYVRAKHGARVVETKKWIEVDLL